MPQKTRKRPLGLVVDMFLAYSSLLVTPAYGVQPVGEPAEHLPPIAPVTVDFRSLPRALGGEHPISPPFETGPAQFPVPAPEIEPASPPSLTSSAVPSAPSPSVAASFAARGDSGWSPPDTMGAVETLITLSWP